MTPDIQSIKDAYQRKGYTFFDGDLPFNLNLWGIRKQTGEINIFDDIMGVIYKDEDGKEVMHFHPATVDPGKYYLVDKKATPRGTFILAPGQYKGAWVKAKHKGLYWALCQKSDYTGFKGWRDNMLNGKIDRRLGPDGHFYNDVRGLNMHRSGESFTAVVGRYSAACQVRQSKEDHQLMMSVVNKALEIFPNSFTYTLFDEEDVFPNNMFELTRSGEKTLKKKWPDDYFTVEKKE